MTVRKLWILCFYLQTLLLLKRLSHYSSLLIEIIKFNKTFCCFWQLLMTFFNVISLGFFKQASGLCSFCDAICVATDVAFVTPSKDVTPTSPSLSFVKIAIGNKNIFCLVKGEIFCRIYFKYLMHLQTYTRSSWLC